ncbi:MAG: T9SS type A sorting domain-containing protein [candidate division WOR-3 bacterium]
MGVIFGIRITLFLRCEIYTGVGVEELGDSCDGIYLFGGSSKYVQALLNPQPLGIEEPKEKEHPVSNIILPSHIAANSINFTYKGNKLATLVIRDVLGRVIKEYPDVKPETSLEFGGEGISSGIYFIGVKGNKESEKVVLVR